MLPTLGAARYTGGLWVGKFLKTLTYQEVRDLTASAKLGEMCGRLSRLEKFEGHARSGDVRAARSGSAPLPWGRAPTRVTSERMTRIEHDLLGDREVPADAYWGVHTLRAVENFPITGQPLSANLTSSSALAAVKQAAAQTNRSSACCSRRGAPTPSRRPATRSGPASCASSSSWTSSRAAPARRRT